MWQNTSGTHVPFLSDVINGLTRYPPGRSWDHKPEIIDRWGDRSQFTIDGVLWEIHHDAWSNIHFGFVNQHNHDNLPGTLPVTPFGNPLPLGLDPSTWNSCAQSCPFVGRDNPLDLAYMEFGNQLYSQFGADITQSEFVGALATVLPEWAATNRDATAPEMVG